MTAIAGYGGKVYLAAGTSTTFTSEALTDSGDHTTYTITTTSKRFWDDTASFTVEESTNSGSTWHAAPATYSLQYVGGKLIYASARSAGNLYRVSGKYYTISLLADAYEWDLDMQLQTQEATVFGQAFETSVPILRNATASVKRFWNDDTLAWPNLNAATRLVLLLYTDEGNTLGYQAYAWLPKISVKTPQKGLVEHPLDFKINGQFYITP